MLTIKEVTGEGDRSTEYQNIVGGARDAESERESSVQKRRTCGMPLKGLMGKRTLPEELEGVREVGRQPGVTEPSKKSASRVRAERTWSVQDPPLLFGLHIASPDLSPGLGAPPASSTSPRGCLTGLPSNRQQLGRTLGECKGIDVYTPIRKS